MVHALKEARRVLKPDGLLLDLRPAPVHRRVGVARAGRYTQLGAMREIFDDDHAADRAVAQVVGGGLFTPEGRIRFDVRRTMDSRAEFRAWMAEFVALDRLPSHDSLVKRVERALAGKQAGTKIVVRGPLDLRLLRKRQARRGRTPGRR